MASSESTVDIKAKLLLRRNGKITPSQAALETCSSHTHTHTNLEQGK